jgi:hypothetical protein
MHIRVRSVFSMVKRSLVLARILYELLDVP